MLATWENLICKGDRMHCDLIQRITSNDASKLTVGKAQYSCMPNKEGVLLMTRLFTASKKNNAYMFVVKCRKHHQRLAMGGWSQRNNAEL